MNCYFSKSVHSGGGGLSSLGFTKAGKGYVPSIRLLPSAAQLVSSHARLCLAENNTLHPLSYFWLVIGCGFLSVARCEKLKSRLSGC